MSQTQDRAARFGPFTVDERDVLHFMLTQGARRLMEDAGDAKIQDELLPQAAVTFALASIMVSDLDRVASRPTFATDENTWELAQAIAEGFAPEIARFHQVRDVSNERG